MNRAFIADESTVRRRIASATTGSRTVANVMQVNFRKLKPTYNKRGRFVSRDQKKPGKRLECQRRAAGLYIVGWRTS
ncbi:MAG TPA: hypothetical protein VMU33_09510 [Burkholderiaceae bacterium]|nr:hypothetical protein [Burkholderiaceae bacterium]